MAARSRKQRLPKGWPTKDGRPATREEINAWITSGQKHFGAPRYPTDPHFCSSCTQPLEHEPCHVCAKAFAEKAALYCALLGDTQ